MHASGMIHGKTPCAYVLSQVCREVDTDINMDFSVIPDFIAIGGLVAVFWSLLKHTRQTRLHYWLLGWVLILIHIMAQFIGANLHHGVTTANAVSVCMLLMTSVTFIWAGNDMRDSGSRTLRLTLLAAIPDVLFLACLVYDVQSGIVYYALTAAALLASLWVFRGGQRASDRRERTVRNTCIVLVYAAQAFLIHQGAYEGAAIWTLFWHYLAVAVFFRLGSPRTTVGVTFTTLSFIAWALVFPVSLAFGAFLPGVHVEREVWNLPKFLVATGMIFTLLEEQMARAEHASLHDALTALPNRRLFVRRLRHAIDKAQLRGHSIALLVIDLNNFKQVNDRLGHAVGDTLLQHVAARFSRCMRANDALARLGGDEFAVILDDVRDRETARAVVDKLHAALDAPFDADGHTLASNASIGLSLYPDDGADERRRYAFADRHMYEYKVVARTHASGRQPELTGDPVA